MKAIHVLGTLLLLYGSIRLFIGVVALSIPPEKRDFLRSIPYIHGFVSKDTTVAGKILDISIVLFGMYSIFRGVYLLGISKRESFTQMMESRSIAYVLYGVMGVFLVMFYSAVVYTPVGIQKNQKEIPTYKLIGIGTGLFFLVVLTLMYSYHSYQGFGMPHFVVVVFVLIMLVSSMVFVAKDSIDKINQKKNEIVTLMMIPLGAA